MPYRRLPKTDAARLKALKMFLSNNNAYMYISHCREYGVVYYYRRNEPHDY